jgi:hypothetical protein
MALKRFNHIFLPGWMAKNPINSGHYALILMPKGRARTSLGPIQTHFLNSNYEWSQYIPLITNILNTSEICGNGWLKCLIESFHPDKKCDEY